MDYASIRTRSASSLFVALSRVVQPNEMSTQPFRFGYIMNLYGFWITEMVVLGIFAVALRCGLL